MPTSAGRLVAHRHAAIDTKNLGGLRLLDVEQSNSALVRGQRDFFKWSRRIEGGAGIELEMAQTLGEARFPHVPAFFGHISYVRDGGAVSPQGVLQEYPAQRHAGLGAGPHIAARPLRVRRGGGGVSALERWELVDDQGGSFRARPPASGKSPRSCTWRCRPRPRGVALAPAPGPGAARRLGRRHDRPARRLLRRADPAVAPLRGRAGHRAPASTPFARLQDGGLAIRVHGDYHLGQVLRTDDGWKIIDFEGEPARRGRGAAAAILAAP